MNLIEMLGIDAYPTQDENDDFYMSPQQKTHFRRILTSWKEQLSSSSCLSKQALNHDLAGFSDLNDRASHEEELTLLLRKQSRDGKLIARIEKTIRQLDAGNYGFCSLCDCEIGIKRLEVRPVAQLCFDCKSISEETENV